MTEPWQAIEYVFTKTPSRVIALLLVGASGAFSFHLLLKLERVGDKWYRKGIWFLNSAWYMLWRNYPRRAIVDEWPLWPMITLTANAI